MLNKSMTCTVTKTTTLSLLYPKKQKIEVTKIYFHGGCINNSNPDVTKREMHVCVCAEGRFSSFTIAGKGSNQQAAFLALIDGLELALRLEKKYVELLGHNEFIVALVNGNQKIRKADELRPLLKKFRELEVKFEWLEVCWIPSEQNKAARH